MATEIINTIDTCEEIRRRFKEIEEKFVFLPITPTLLNEITMCYYRLLEVEYGLKQLNYRIVAYGSDIKVEPLDNLTKLVFAGIYNHWNPLDHT